jgi:hypothetical protein
MIPPAANGTCLHPRFSEFVARTDAFDPTERVSPRVSAVLFHSECDGLATGAILAKALERIGHRVAVEATGKGGSA